MQSKQKVRDQEAPDTYKILLLGWVLLTGKYSHNNMIFTREQRNTAYKKLSPEVQDFIMDNETTELIGHYLIEAGLSEDQLDSADSEILYALFGLQTLAETIANIAKFSNKNVNDLSKLKNNLENNIFSKIQSGKSINAQEISKTQSNSQITSRVGEVGKKYSLSDSQIEKLVNKVNIVIKYPDQKNNLLDTIVTDLDISRLLAEQVMGELETRVFEYALARIQNKESRIEKGQNADKVSLDSKLEIPNSNLPMVEKDMSIKTTTPQTAPKVVPQTPPKTILQPEPKAAPQSTREPVQKPFAVPRFTATPVTEKKPPEKPIENKTSTEKPFSILDFVQKTPPAPPAPPVPPPPPAPPQPVVPKPTSSGAVNTEASKPNVPPQKYTADPYREPIN